jgi:hypothetical protein
MDSNTFGFVPHLESLNSLIMSVVTPPTLALLANVVMASDPAQPLVHAPAFFEHRSIDCVALCAPAALSCLLQLVSRVLRFQPSLVGTIQAFPISNPVPPLPAAIFNKTDKLFTEISCDSVSSLSALPQTTESKQETTVASPRVSQSPLILLLQSLCHADHRSDAAVFDLLRHELEHPALLQVKSIRVLISLDEYAGRHGERYICHHDPAPS